MFINFAKEQHAEDRTVTKKKRFCFKCCWTDLPTMFWCSVTTLVKELTIWSQNIWLSRLSQCYCIAGYLHLLLCFIGNMNSNLATSDLISPLQLINYFFWSVISCIWLDVPSFNCLTIRLWARDFYEVIVDEVEGRINNVFWGEFKEV